jgi:hypothetical protein
VLVLVVLVLVLLVLPLWCSLYFFTSILLMFDIFDFSTF